MRGPREGGDVTALSPAEQLVRRALEQFQTAETAEAPLRAEAQLDLEFLNLQQWKTDDQLDRESHGKPTLVIDQIGEPYRQLVGSLRRAHPGIQVSPVDSGADIDTAERYQGAIRQIERTGGAKAAREEAFKGAVGPGWGYYRLYTEYVEDEGRASDPAALFDQAIKYQAIENTFTVYRDPVCPLHEPWKARFCLIVEDIPTSEFRRRWPTAIATGAEAFAASGIPMPDWYPETSVRVADYFYLETVEDPPVALLADGRVVPVTGPMPRGMEVIQQRTPTRVVVRLAKITGTQILEGNADKTAGREQPWPFIPVVPVYGEALTVNGKRFLRGIVRAARDPQRMYNYQNSELVYELALAPKSKVIMAEGQMEGYEPMWKDAPTKAFPALFYKPTAIGGERVPEPRVAQFTDPAKIQALVVAINQHKADLRSTTGWYDATDPNRRNADQSGRAILARREAQAEGSTNYLDNFAEALQVEGLLLLGAIPKLYNRPGRGIRMTGLEDDTTSEVLRLGQPVTGKDGRAAYFEWGAGRYDVTARTGASYGTRRQEAASFQIELLKVLPPQMGAAMAPIAIRNMDGPGNTEIADRLDRTLPAEIRGDEKKTESDPAQLQQQLTQAMQMNEALTKQLEAATQAIQTEEVKRGAELQKTQQVEQTKLQIAHLNAEVEAMKVRAEMIKLTAELDAESAKVAVVEETKRLLAFADLDARPMAPVS